METCTTEIPEVFVLSRWTLETLSYFFTWHLGKFLKPVILSDFKCCRNITCGLCAQWSKWEACYLLSMTWFILLGRWTIPQPPSFAKNLDLFLVQLFLCWSMKAKTPGCGQLERNHQFFKWRFFWFCHRILLEMHILWQLFDGSNFFNTGATSTVSYAGRQHGCFRRDICHLHRSSLLISISWWN